MQRSVDQIRAEISQQQENFLKVAQSLLAQVAPGSPEAAELVDIINRTIHLAQTLGHNSAILPDQALLALLDQRLNLYEEFFVIVSRLMNTTDFSI